MSAAVTGALVGAGAGVLAAPYLAGLTLTVPDRECRAWWRGARAGPRRVVGTALLGAAVGALAGGAAGWTPLLPAYVALALVGTVLVVVDAEHHRLPNRLVHPLAAATVVLLGLAALAQHEWPALLRAAEAGAAVFGVLLALVLAAPRSFGFGDVKLGGVLGAYLGWFGWAYVYYGVFAGFALGAVLALILLAARRATMKTALPFGPTLLLGALLVAAFDLVPDTLW